MALSIPRIVLGGVSSGVGKTTVTLAVARALAARGLRVALFKCGPDYLDPTYHARATRRASENLDGWMMGRDAVRETFASAAAGADIAVVEGVMGLFDGASPTSESGSTAEIAKWLEAPVVLVVDAGGMARSFAAVVSGFATFDGDLTLGGVVANRVGSAAHLELLRKAQRTPPVLGGLPKDGAHAFAERHLGLVTADERVLPDALLEHWGARARDGLDLDALVALARSAPPFAAAPPPAPRARPVCRVGLARDEAFHFYYDDNLRRLEAAGAELVPFSPVKDAAPPAVDGLYLGGGYPEVHAAALAANGSMRAAVLAFARRGGPVYAECGGLMYLTEAIRTAAGERFPMVGLFPTEAHVRGKLQALGYVEVETQRPTLLGEAGTRFRGHQFRYSELSPPLDGAAVDHVYSLRKRRGGETQAEGYHACDVVASYVHAHWASNPRVPLAFVARCARFAEGRAA